MLVPIIVQKKSFKVELEPGFYSYCTCGWSASQPFCDDSHIGTGFEPLEFEITEKRIYSICGCKHTLTPPFCDHTHRTL